MSDKIIMAYEWLFKQAPVIVLLIGTNIAQYNYFTTKIETLENRLENIQDKYIDHMKK